MILNTAERHIERVSSNPETNFRIKASGAAFRILSSSLYKDKIGAIVREICCNAYDSHIAAGKPNHPIKVHLPNRLEPFFSVRDDGVGLSAQSLEHVFTTYFESTKADSNEMIGAFGLGSKAPFSYVDTFNIVSRFNGEMLTYTAYIAESGEPRLTLMSNVPTDEDNGVEISMAVKYFHDFSDFEYKAKEILSRFNPRPIVVGGSGLFQFEERNSIVVGDGWSISNRKPYESGTSYAVMGQVAYPISLDSIRNTVAYAVFSAGIETTFPIGALDVTAGREELSYDKPTIAALEARAKSIIEEAPARIQEQFDNCSNEFEARFLYYRLVNVFNITKQLKCNDTKFFFNGKALSSFFELDLKNFPGASIEIFQDEKRRYKKITHPQHSKVSISVHTNPIIVLDDLEGVMGYNSRLMNRRKSNSKETLVVVRGNREARTEVRKFLNGCKFISVSMLPKPPRAKSVVREKSKGMVINWQFGSAKKINRECWTNQEFDIEEGGFYVRAKKYVVCMKNGEESYQFQRIYSLAEKLKIITDDMCVFGVDAKTAAACEASGIWVEAHDYIQECVEKLVGDQTFIEGLRRATLVNKHWYIDEFRSIFKDIQRQNPGHPIADFASQYWDDNLGTGNLQAVKELSRLMDKSRGESDDSLMIAFEDIIKTYPLLMSLRSNNNLDSYHVQRYIQLVDKGDF